jgi:CubicO group peptidase (beta-lactamase class C family)
MGTIFGKTKTTYEKMTERRFAPTEDCPWREKVLHGEVHDPHSFAMGGVAGHAGLFSTVQDLNKFVTELVKCYRGESDFIPQETVKQFLCFDEKLTYKKSSWLLGWDTPSSKNSSSGKYFSSESIGHLGYTGCSVWIDLKKDFWVILLTNRLHPSDTNQKIKLFRPHIHDIIFESLIK